MLAVGPGSEDAVVEVGSAIDSAVEIPRLVLLSSSILESGLQLAGESV